MSRSFIARIFRAAGWLVSLLAAASLSSNAADHPKPELNASPDSSLYLKIQLSNVIKVSKLKTGDVVDGKLSQDVYSGDRELFPAGSPVHLTVDKLERVRRVPNDHWPWVVKFFAPRHQNSPIFRSASVGLADGKEVPLRVSLLSIGSERPVHAQVKKTSADMAVPNEVAPSAAKSKKSAPLRIVTLEATALALVRTETGSSQDNSSAASSLSGPGTLAAGTQATVILLSSVSATKSRPGDSFQARLVEPVRLDSNIVLPEGTQFEGTVVKSTAPRMLGRAGSLLLTFTSLTLPGETPTPIAASVTEAELDQRSHTKIDPEGKLHGDHPGKAWMLINIGATGGIAKETDDGLQLAIEAFVSTATDASTAGVGRIAATCASTLFMLTRHGRDVILPKFTQMNIMFDRPASLPGSFAAPPGPTTENGPSTSKPSSER